MKVLCTLVAVLMVFFTIVKAAMEEDYEYALQFVLGIGFTLLIWIVITL
jgi:hypothetical protein